VTAVGGGLVLAGGIAMGILARSKANDFKSVPQSDAKFAETRASVRNTAIAADVMMGVGIAAGIAWFTMEFGVKHKQAITIPNSSFDDDKGRSGDEKKEEKKVDPDDPFASLVPSPHVPDWFAMPLPGGVSLGVQGSF
jgi:hypothetical protein